MLKINDLHFSFGSKVIFSGLNLNFNADEVSGIVGKNGVGKTTLFRIMSGIYKNQKGKLIINEVPLHPSDISFMSTEPYFYPYMKGEEYLNIVANSAQEKKLSLDYALSLELPLNDLVDNYSTGMRKKLAFSALYALSRPVIILDEPYNGVDLESNEMIKHIIKTHHKDKIVILSSHILSTLTDISQQIFHITDRGKVSLFKHDQFDDLENRLMQDVQARKTVI
jgi:ABC-2 type transport system ATP-binding protein